MDATEAINWISEHFPPDDETEQSKAIRIALSALEKQAGKFPVVTRKFYDQEDWTKTYHCPICNAVFIHEDFSDGFYAGRKFNYCPDCGQKIDWSVT